jgi:DNA-binding NtrC family response regulator
MKTIMIIDEKPDSLERIQSSLKNEEFEVVTAINSRKALEQLKEENEETFDLIMIHSKMPGSKTTGFFTIKPAEKKQPNVAEQFLEEPFTKQQLVTFVKKTLKYSD